MAKQSSGLLGSLGFVKSPGAPVPHRKHTSACQTVEMPVPATVTIVMSQHIGAPATPIVAVGDSVKKGQKIAEAGGFVSSPIYSSVSGTVKKIEPRRVAVGDMVNSIVIESDDQFTECEYSPVDDVTSLSREKIIDRIKEAGVVGMGGAGFPTHVKLSPKEP